MRDGRVAVSDPAASVLQAANSETGVVQELPAGARLRRRGAGGGAGALRLRLERGADGDRRRRTSSAAPKGVGALLVAPGVGGGAGGCAAAGRRCGGGPGTENVIGIAGFGAAIEAAAAESGARRLGRGGRGAEYSRGGSGIGGVGRLFLSGKPRGGCRTRACFAVPGWKGETQVMQMDLAGFAVSAGSACSSGKVRASRVLTAMGLGPEVGDERHPGLDRPGDDARRGAGLRRRLGETLPPVPRQGRLSGMRERKGEMAGFDEISVREGVDQETVDAVRSVGERYKYGFSSDIETEFAPKGLNEDIVRLISEKNGEPEWLSDWRLKAYRRWLQMEHQPDWAMLTLPDIDFQEQYYYARPKSMAVRPKSLDEVDPALLATYEKLGIPLKEQMILAGVDDGAPAEGRRVAVDAVFDSVSLGTTFKDGAGQGRGDLLRDLRGDAGASGAGAEISRHRRALQRQLLCDAELGGVLGRVVRLCAAGRALPDGALDLFPDQRREHRAVRADADHRRQGVATSATSRAARRRSATPASCTRRWWRSWRSRTPR